MAGDLQKYLIQDLELLHDDRDSADLEFVASGGGGKAERIRAHRLIVLCRCRRYRAKKQQWLTANSPLVTVKLERTEPETARRVVRYLYTGRVSVGERCYLTRACSRYLNLHLHGCLLGFILQLYNVAFQLA